MLPVIALVGRPNVGKSTLFNALTRTRDALVADYPGLTRDRQYGYGRIGPRPYIVIDTGGLSGEQDGLDGLMAEQTLRALDEADVVLFVTDAREGCTAADEQAAALLRRRAQRLWLVVNKAEGLAHDMAAADFQQFGIGEVASISAAHHQGLRALMDAVIGELPEESAEDDAAESSSEQGLLSRRDPDAIRIALLGRPNAGKSTLVNRLLGDERVLASDTPGTTRDAVCIPFERNGQRFELVDTAGVRRRSKVNETIEKFSVVKTLQAVENANVVIAMVDARVGVTDLDANLLGLALERGRATIVAINKWDGLSPDKRDDVRRQIDVKLPFLDFAPRHFISALHGTGVGDLLGSVRKAFSAAVRELATAEVTRALEDALQAHPPPTVRGRRPRLRYAHQGGRNPPIIVIHGTQADRLPRNYQRYLVNFFRARFKLEGTPVRVELRTTENPFAGRRNKLTPRQEIKRKRLIKHVKQKKK
ncbi:MAG: ribosome biogenesis GTPase Der [Pseudomonadota bacterium]